MQLMTSLLESNPFAARLETEDLVKKLEEEEKKLAALCPEEVTYIIISRLFQRDFPLTPDKVDD